MHPATVRLHHFFVPNRLSWDQETAGVTWEEFITGGKDGKDGTASPQVSVSEAAHSLTDYFGIPRTAGLSINKMPVRAYNLIFNEFYRDQDLVDELTALDTQSIQRVAWEKDYFTTARPWPQKGDAVTLPIGARAPVLGFGKQNPNFPDGPQTFRESDGTDREYTSSSGISDTDADNHFSVEQHPDHEGYPNLYADLSEATGVNINEVRKAFALQRFAEARARYGSRYTEYLRYLGVRSKDARLQRPEYLGGGKVQVSISEVLQTGPDAQGGEDSFVGDLYGHGIAALRSNRYRRHFEEHGYVLSLLSVRPKAIYESGTARHFLRRFREDYWQKELQHIGQQEIWNEEVFAEGGAEKYGTWGYSDRYSEYRNEQSKVTSEFRDILDFWHMARKFEDAPALNETFVKCVPSKRIFSEQTQHSLWIFVQHRLMARRLVGKSAESRIM